MNASQKSNIMSKQERNERFVPPTHEANEFKVKSDVNAAKKWALRKFEIAINNAAIEIMDKYKHKVDEAITLFGKNAIKINAGSKCNQTIANNDENASTTNSNKQKTTNEKRARNEIGQNTDDEIEILPKQPASKKRKILPSK